MNLMDNHIFRRINESHLLVNPLEYQTFYLHNETDNDAIVLNAMNTLTVGYISPVKRRLRCLKCCLQIEFYPNETFKMYRKH